MRSRARYPVALACLAAVAISGGCAQPGTQVPKADAARLDVATSRISVACGYEEELTATGRPAPAALAPIESIADSGARKLVSVFKREQTDIYQGESVGAIVHDSVSLLAGCRLPAARLLLQRALRGSG